MSEEKSIILERLYRDKINTKSSEFLDERKEKAAGVSAGYIGIRAADNSIHMIKSVSKTYVKTEKDGLYFAPNRRREYNRETGEIDLISPKRMANENRNDFQREYIASGLYQRILFDRAPKVNLVIDSKDSRTIALNSKFLNDFTLYSEFNSFDNPPQGFEKIMAASLSLGDMDFHNKNVGILITPEGNRFARIDYGRALSTFYQSPRELILEFEKMFRLFKYDKDEHINVKAVELRNAIDKITKVSESEIDNIIDYRVHQLEQAEFNPDGNIAYYNENGVQKYNISTEDNRYRNLEKFYKGKLKIQFKTMESISKILSVVEKIDIRDSKWKEKQWLADLASVGGDPFRYAIENNLTIEKKSPLEWAIENNYKIEDKDPIKWAIDNHFEFDINENGIKDKIEGIEWAIKNGYKIEDKDPIVFAIRNKIKINDCDPLEWAIRKNIKIKNQDPLIWALTYDKKIDGQDPLKWAKDHKRGIYDVKKRQIIDAEDWFKKNVPMIEGLRVFQWAKKNMTKLDLKLDYSGETRRIKSNKIISH